MFRSLLVVICLASLTLAGCGISEQKTDSGNTALDRYLLAVIQKNPQELCQNLAGMYVYQSDNSNNPWDLDFAASVGLLSQQTLIATPECSIVAKSYIDLLRNNKIVSTPKGYKVRKDRQALKGYQRALGAPKVRPVFENSNLRVFVLAGHRFTLFKYQGRWGVVPEGVNSSKLLRNIDCSNSALANTAWKNLCSSE